MKNLFGSKKIVPALMMLTLAVLVLTVIMSNSLKSTNIWFYVWTVCMPLIGVSEIRENEKMTEPKKIKDGDKNENF
jgi:low temperature requirement protein LtrA